MKWIYGLARVSAFAGAATMSAGLVTETPNAYLVGFAMVSFGAIVGWWDET